VKVIRKAPETPALWEWLQSRLPAGLVAYTRDDGYGQAYGITIKERGMAGLLNRWFGESIALVRERTVELQHPEWASDFSDLLTRYEAEGGKETTLLICAADTSSAPTSGTP
jgi:hypothetical protein